MIMEILPTHDFTTGHVPVNLRTTAVPKRKEKEKKTPPEDGPGAGTS